MFSWFLKVWNFLASCNCLRSFSSFIDCAKLARWATGSLWTPTKCWPNAVGLDISSPFLAAKPSSPQLTKNTTNGARKKNNWPYFPLNTGCLIGILIIFYYNPLYKWVGFHPSIVSKNPRPYQENLKKIHVLVALQRLAGVEAFFLFKSLQIVHETSTWNVWTQKKRMDFPHIDSATKKNLAQGCFESNWMKEFT